MKRNPQTAGFSLLEVIVAAGLLGLGLLSIVQVFPLGLQVAQRAEDVTKASVLARAMFEGLKADSRDFPVIPGDPITLIPLPGNGFDDDNDWALQFRNNPEVVDINNNGRPDVDFDGFGEPRYLLGNDVDDDGDGVIDDDGDGMRGSADQANSASMPHQGAYRVSTFIEPDGNFSYDPEPFVEEEWCNGLDDDGDGLVDEDCHLATSQQATILQAVRSSGGRLSSYDSVDIGRRPLVPGDGIDNDFNGEADKKRANDSEDKDDEFVFDEVHDAKIRRANQLDDNGDGQIDEGIDDRVMGRGVFRLADTQMARFPWGPMRFPAPYDRYAWQIFTGPVSDTDVPPELASIFPQRYATGNLGDGADNDGDGLIDEELLDGQDNDYDGRIDEDCIAAPLPGWLKVEIVISWGGDGLNNDASSSNCGPATNISGETEAPEDRIEFPDCAVDPRVNLKLFTTNYPDNLSGALRSSIVPDFGHIAWGIDEEMADGLDNDFDGQIDEDVHLYEYRLVGFISLRDRTRSFPILAAR